MIAHGLLPKLTWIFPLLAALLYAGVTTSHYEFAPSSFAVPFALVLLVMLFGTVFAAVHHAEVIARGIGEPYGTLLLTLSVTIIEVALIATMMLEHQERKLVAWAAAIERDAPAALSPSRGATGKEVFSGRRRHKRRDRCPARICWCGSSVADSAPGERHGDIGSPQG